MSQDFNPACLARQDTERIRRYREMLDFYRGYQWPDRAVRGENHLTLNYARAIIDKITSYLASGLHPAVSPADGTDTARPGRRRSLSITPRPRPSTASQRPTSQTAI
jgi:hypothetical protein